MSERVIYLVRSWPRLSQTFIVNEVLALERRGLELAIYSLVRSGEEIVQPQVADVRAPVSYLEDQGRQSWLDRVHRQFSALADAPMRYTRTLLFCLRHPGLAAGYGDCSTLRCFAHAVQVARAVERMRAAGDDAIHVHAHFAHDPALVGLLVARLTGLPFSFTAHARDLLQIPASSLAARAAEATALVTCCEANAAYIAMTVPSPRRPCVQVIHHGVELGRLLPSPRDPATPVPALLSVGRLVEKKGFPDLLHALAECKAAGGRFTCRIYGDGPLRGELTRLRDALGLRQQVEFRGARTSEQILAALGASDVFLLTPRVGDDGDRDGIPNVLVEAMACGLPVVTTAAGGITELVRSDVNGLVTAPGDISALAGAVGRLLLDAVLRRRLGEAARHTVEADYDVDVAARALELVFRPRVTGEPEATPVMTQLAAALSPLTSGIPTQGDVWATSEPGRFAEAQQPRLMGPRLASAVGGGGQTCHILDAKYEPGARAFILYEYGGRLVRGDLLTPLVAPGGGIEKCPIVAPGIRISVFPDDPDLPGLPQVMDAGRLGPLLAKAIGERSSIVEERRARRCRILLLRYRPGKRATVLVRWAATPAYVAKVYHDPAKAAAVTEEAQALAAATTSQGMLRLAPTVTDVPELSLVVQQEVKGLPLDALLGTTRICGPKARDAVRMAAQALAELHELPEVTRRQRPVEHELQRFGLRASRIGTVDPQLGMASAELAQRLVSVHADLPPARTGVVHGDCKPSQFLLNASHVYLLDLDHCGVSDQAADVGTFLASLRQLATRHALVGRSPALSDELDALADTFLQVYLDRVGDGRLLPRVRWQEAVALERKALRTFARAPGSPLAAELVKEANRCLDAMTPAA